MTGVQTCALPIWITLPVSDDTGSVVTSLPVAGNTGKAGFDFKTGYYAVRIVYAPTGGTGFMTARFNGKVQ